jgi:hypothetical protein
MFTVKETIRENQQPRTRVVFICVKNAFKAENSLSQHGVD